MDPNTILIVPGIWEGPTVFNDLANALRQDGFEVHIAQLASTGTVSPGNPSMKDDVKSIRSSLEPLVSSGKDVTLLLHSAGGFLGSEAMQGLDRPSRKGQGKEGGVVKIIFLTAGIAPEGYQHQPLPFAEERDGAIYAKDVRHTFFHDFSDADAEKWMAVLRPQPADGWRTSTDYCGWRDVPSVYLIAKQDAIIPLAIQERFLGLAQCIASEVVDAGHMLMLSKPQEVHQLVKKHARL